MIWKYPHDLDGMNDREKGQYMMNMLVNNGLSDLPEAYKYSLELLKLAKDNSDEIEILNILKKRLKYKMYGNQHIRYPHFCRTFNLK